MRKLIVFNHVSLDGYFTDANGNMSFAQNPIPDAEWDAFVAGNAGNGGMPVFGRVTYDLMVSFWPTPLAAEQMPDVAERMNNLPKVVFSRTMNEASWNNTMLVKEDMAGVLRKMKQAEGDNMVIFGSGSIVSQLAQEGLIDEYQFVGSRRPRQRQDHVRWPQREADSEADKIADLRQWEHPAVLRAETERLTAKTVKSAKIYKGFLCVLRALGGKKKGLFS